MAKKAKFKPVKAVGKGWRLSIPPKYSESGKREQYFYKTQALADVAADSLKARRDEFGVTGHFKMHHL